MFVKQNMEKVTTMEEYIEKFRDRVQDGFHESQMSEEDKAKELQKILRKLKSGVKLTGDELSFIKRFYPQMYSHVMRVQNQRQQLENQLKSAKSKEEAAQIFANAMGGIAKDDPDKEMLQAAYSKAYTEFQSTAQYRSLPETNQEAKKEKQKSSFEEDQVEQEKKRFLYPEFDRNA